MLILASQSPRRKELLKKIYKKDFLTIPSYADEEKAQAPSLEELPEAISLLKGQDISLQHPNDYVISADTIVIFQNQKFGKPKDEQEAYRMLSSLNEKEHEVVTGYHIFLNGKPLISSSSKSFLILHNLTKEQIEKYIKTRSPFDKAGAYGIQDRDYISYTLVSGSFDNVMGFPTEDIRKHLSELKII
jgi:septum formation protein